MWEALLGPYVSVCLCHSEAVDEGQRSGNDDTSSRLCQGVKFWVGDP